MTLIWASASDWKTAHAVRIPPNHRHPHKVYSMCDNAPTFGWHRDEAGNIIESNKKHCLNCERALQGIYNSENKLTKYAWKKYSDRAMPLIKEDKP